MSAVRSDNVDRIDDRSTVESMGPARVVEPDAPITVGVAISVPQPWAEVLDAVSASWPTAQEARQRQPEAAPRAIQLDCL